MTGFSFLGHASEMATGSDVQLEINTAAIDLIPEALDFARMGILPAGMYRNRTFAEPMVDAGDTELAVQDATELIASAAILSGLAKLFAEKLLLLKDKTLENGGSIEIIE